MNQSIMKNPMSKTPNLVCSEVPDFNCSGCQVGINMCKHCPCIGTPEEMYAIAKEYPERLAGTILVMIPASIIAPKRKVNGECPFLEDNLCILHDKGLKPSEGRKACCNNPLKGIDLQRTVANTWPISLQQRLLAEDNPVPVFIEIMKKKEEES